MTSRQEILDVCDEWDSSPPGSRHQRDASIRAITLIQSYFAERAAPLGGGAAQPAYRIALRPDGEGEDPMDPETLLDDIVVRDVSMFRAEQMEPGRWWVCCYLSGDDPAIPDDRITWQVSARRGRIHWVTSEYPDDAVRYEHEEGQ